jgi:hypothetical protein
MDGITRFIVLTAAIAFVLAILIALAVLATRWARKGSASASFAGWALLLLTVGMNPQPPPQEQVEEANRQKKIKKDAESGDPET